MLLAECSASGVDLRLGHRVTGLDRSDRFGVDTDQGRFTAASLVLATGGLSIPKLGATSFAYEAARRFGLALTSMRPALVPLTAGAEDLSLMRPLSGVALPVAARCGRHVFEEAMLFTHRGLSGPAILQLSSAWREGETLVLLGETRGELGASLYLREVHGREEGAPPPVALAAERRAGTLVRRLIAEGVTRCVHDLSDGGLAVAAAETALASGVGLAVQAPEGSPAHAALFGEDQGRYLLTVAPDRLDALDEACADEAVAYAVAGRVGGCELLLTDVEGAELCAIDLTDLRAAHEGWLPAFMGEPA